MRSRTRLALAGVGALLAPALVVSSPVVPPAAAADCVPVDAYRDGVLRPDLAGLPAVAGANFGSAVAAGDFNKDGYADVAVGAPNDVVSGNASGAVYIFPGSATGPRIGAGVAKRLTQTDIGAGNEAGDRFGASLAVGDFNRVGYADLAIGVPGESPSVFDVTPTGMTVTVRDEANTVIYQQTI